MSAGDLLVLVLLAFVASRYFTLQTIKPSSLSFSQTFTSRSF